MALAVLGCTCGRPGPASAAAIGAIEATTLEEGALRDIRCAVADGLRAASAGIARRLGRSRWGAEVTVQLSLPAGREPDLAPVGDASRTEQVAYFLTARDIVAGRASRDCVRSSGDGSGPTVDARPLTASVSDWLAASFGTGASMDLRPGALDVVAFEMRFSVLVDAGDARRATVVPWSGAPAPEGGGGAGSVSVVVGRLGSGWRSAAPGAGMTAAGIGGRSARSLAPRPSP